MGTPKPLLEWGGRTLIEYQLEQLHRPPVDRVVVVLGHRAEEVLQLVHRAGALAVINEFYREGRASSVRVGSAALGEDTEAAVVVNVDQPRPHWVIERLVREHVAGGNLITVPSHRGVWGHPGVFAGSLLPEMREVREATEGLRAILHRHEGQVVPVPFESDVVLLDMNLPDVYEKARVTYFQHPPNENGEAPEVRR